jgi:hypothetical protein
MPFGSGGKLDTQGLNGPEAIRSRDRQIEPWVRSENRRDMRPGCYRPLEGKFRSHALFDLLDIYRLRASS